MKPIRIDKDLVAASATSLVLGILAEQESYGYAILRRIADLSGGRLSWNDGMLYPLLHRLERGGQVSSSWHVAETGRRRKLYRITAEGRTVLAERRSQWQVVSEALGRIWDDFGADPALGGA